MLCFTIGALNGIPAPKLFLGIFRHRALCFGLRMPHETPYLPVPSLHPGPRLTALGCYRDSPFGQRIFSTLLQRVQVRAWWHPDVSVIIRTCRDAAVARGYRIFSIQNLRECRWGPTAERDYARYGFGWYCYRGVGWYDSGSVYRVDTSAPG